MLPPFPFLTSSLPFCVGDFELTVRARIMANQCIVDSGPSPSPEAALQRFPPPVLFPTQLLRQKLVHLAPSLFSILSSHPFSASSLDFHSFYTSTPLPSIRPLYAPEGDTLQTIWAGQYEANDAFSVLPPSFPASTRTPFSNDARVSKQIIQAFQNQTNASHIPTGATPGSSTTSSTVSPTIPVKNQRIPVPCARGIGSGACKSCIAAWFPTVFNWVLWLFSERNYLDAAAEHSVLASPTFSLSSPTSGPSPFSCFSGTTPLATPLATPDITPQVSPTASFSASPASYCASSRLEPHTTLQLYIIALFASEMLSQGVNPALAGAAVSFLFEYRAQLAILADAKGRTSFLVRYFTRQSVQNIAQVFLNVDPIRLCESRLLDSRVNSSSSSASSTSVNGVQTDATWQFLFLWGTGWLWGLPVSDAQGAATGSPATSARASLGTTPDLAAGIETLSTSSSFADLLAVDSEVLRPWVVNWIVRSACRWTGFGDVAASHALLPKANAEAQVHTQQMSLPGEDCVDTCLFDLLQDIFEHASSTVLPSHINDLFLLSLLNYASALEIDFKVATARTVPNAKSSAKSTTKSASTPALSSNIITLRHVIERYPNLPNLALRAQKLFRILHLSSPPPLSAYPSNSPMDSHPILTFRSERDDESCETVLIGPSVQNASLSEAGGKLGSAPGLRIGWAMLFPTGTELTWHTHSQCHQHFSHLYRGPITPVHAHITGVHTGVHMGAGALPLGQSSTWRGETSNSRSNASDTISLSAHILKRFQELLYPWLDEMRSFLKESMGAEVVEGFSGAWGMQDFPFAQKRGFRYTFHSHAASTQLHSGFLGVRIPNFLEVPIHASAFLDTTNADTILDSTPCRIRVLFESPQEPEGHGICANAEEKRRPIAPDNLTGEGRSIEGRDQWNGHPELEAGAVGGSCGRNGLDPEQYPQHQQLQAQAMDTARKIPMQRVEQGFDTFLRNFVSHFIQLLAPFLPSECTSTTATRSPPGLSVQAIPSPLAFSPSSHNPVHPSNPRPSLHPPVFSLSLAPSLSAPSPAATHASGPAFRRSNYSNQQNTLSAMGANAALNNCNHHRIRCPCLSASGSEATLTVFCPVLEGYWALLTRCLSLSPTYPPSSLTSLPQLARLGSKNRFLAMRMMEFLLKHWPEGAQAYEKVFVKTLVSTLISLLTPPATFALSAHVFLPSHVSNIATSNAFGAVPSLGFSQGMDTIGGVVEDRFRFLFPLMPKTISLISSNGGGIESFTSNTTACGYGCFMRTGGAGSTCHRLIRQGVQRLCRAVSSSNASLASLAVCCLLAPPTNSPSFLGNPNTNATSSPGHATASSGSLPPSFPEPMRQPLSELFERLAQVYPPGLSSIALALAGNVDKSLGPDGRTIRRMEKQRRARMGKGSKEKKDLKGAREEKRHAKPAINGIASSASNSATVPVPSTSGGPPGLPLASSSPRREAMTPFDSLAKHAFPILITDVEARALSVNSVRPSEGRETVSSTAFATSTSSSSAPPTPPTASTQPAVSTDSTSSTGVLTIAPSVGSLISCLSDVSLQSSFTAANSTTHTPLHLTPRASGSHSDRPTPGLSVHSNFHSPAPPSGVRMHENSSSGGSPRSIISSQGLAHQHRRLSNAIGLDVTNGEYSPRLWSPTLGVNSVTNGVNNSGNASNSCAVESMMAFPPRPGLPFPLSTVGMNPHHSNAGSGGVVGLQNTVTPAGVPHSGLSVVAGSEGHSPLISPFAPITSSPLAEQQTSYRNGNPQGPQSHQFVNAYLQTPRSTLTPQASQVTQQLPQGTLPLNSNLSSIAFDSNVYYLAPTGPSSHTASWNLLSTATLESTKPSSDVAAVVAISARPQLNTSDAAVPNPRTHGLLLSPPSQPSSNPSHPKDSIVKVAEKKAKVSKPNALSFAERLEALVQTKYQPKSSMRCLLSDDIKPSSRLCTLVMADNIVHRKFQEAVSAWKAIIDNTPSTQAYEAAMMSSLSTLSNPHETSRKSIFHQSTIPRTPSVSLLASHTSATNGSSSSSPTRASDKYCSEAPVCHWHRGVVYNSMAALLFWSTWLSQTTELQLKSVNVSDIKVAMQRKIQKYRLQQSKQQSKQQAKAELMVLPIPAVHPTLPSPRVSYGVTPFPIVPVLTNGSADISAMEEDILSDDNKESYLQELTHLLSSHNTTPSTLSSTSESENKSVYSCLSKTVSILETHGDESHKASESTSEVFLAVSQWDATADSLSGLPTSASSDSGAGARASPNSHDIPLHTSSVNTLLLGLERASSNSELFRQSLEVVSSGSCID